MSIDQQSNSLADISPLMYIGIFVLVAGYMGPVIRVAIPGWIKTIGFIIILLGAVHTVFMRK